MRAPSLLFRLTATPCLAALLLGAGLVPAVQAQTPPTAADADQQAAVVPPERAGRVAQISGDVSFHTAGAEEWSPAALNYPVATGDALWTEPSATAWVEISASRVALAGGSELDVDALDQNGLQATLAQGETYLHLRDLAPNEVWSVQTPRGAVTFSGAGRYGIAAGDTDDPTLITVLEGAAQLTGPGFSLTVTAGQTATISGTETFQASIGPAAPDAFLTAMQQAEAPPPTPAVPPPPVVAAMPGGDDLAGYGTWTRTPDYGEVWYPRVAAGWVPYRDGHWAYVQPWGWTWIDSASWGFAPFHYGRWVEIHGRWAWTPGTVQVAAPPVYAPALVTFFGIGAGVGTAAALESGRVGWVPLGPHEVYHPWYHASDAYLRAINRHEVTNVTVINQHITINTIINRPGVTVVPARAMTESRPVRQIAQRVDPHLLASARPLAGAVVRPTAATAGITPRLAQRLHLPAPAGTPIAARPAPGPAIHPPQRAAGHGAPARPPLRPAGVVRPGAPAHGAPPGAPAREANHPGEHPPVHPVGVTPLPQAAVQPHAPETLHPVPPHGPAEHPAAAHPAGVEHPAPAPHAPSPEHPPATPHPGAEAHHPPPAAHPATEAGGHPAPEHAPAAEHHPAPQPHPAPVHHPASEPHPAPEAHPAAEHHPAPEAHPAAEHHPAPEPHPVAEHHPAPEPHPAASAHPATPHPPQPNPHAAGAAHPPPHHPEEEKHPGEH